MAISSALGSSALLPAGLGFRNVIINGGMDIWQRGTSGFATSDGTYTADRWRHTSNNLTITRDTDVPSGFRYSAKLVGTSDNSFAQRIEAATSSKLAGKQVYFSCWAKRTSGSGALDVRFYYPSAEDNFASNTQIGSTIVLSSSPSSSWTYYTATITLPSNVSTGLMVLINNVGASTTFITGVQLEANSQPTPFEQRPIGVELLLCQRYYEKSFNLSVAPADGVYSSAYVSHVVYLDYWVLAINWVSFKVEKARVPDMSFFGDAGKWQASNSNNTWTTFAQAPTSAVQGVTGVKSTGFSLGIHNNGANGLNVVGYSRMVRGDWVASAEL